MRQYLARNRVAARLRPVRTYRTVATSTSLMEGIIRDVMEFSLQQLLRGMGYA